MSAKVSALKEAKAKVVAKMRKFAAGNTARPSNPKAQKIAALANEIGGCSKPHLVKLLEELTGLPIRSYMPADEDGDGEYLYEKGMVVVPMTSNDERYVKGSPALVYFENCSVHFNRVGEVVSGARLPEVMKFDNSLIRLASASEVNKFFDALIRVAEDTDWVEIDKVVRATR